MDDKKDKLFKVIVEEYIKTATPVGSGLVVEKYFPELSSATVRNYMVELEDKRLIAQPHTSAGRVPTLAGYKYYIENFLTGGKLSAPSRKTLDAVAKKLEASQDSIKNLAKQLADLSDNAILIGFAPNNVYYTGISNLFRQPEFVEQGLVYSMSEVIDHLDEVMAGIFHKIDQGTKILIGADNPFGELSSVVLAKYQIKKDEGLIGILGPNRMNYQENLGLIKYSQEIINNLI